MKITEVALTDIEQSIITESLNEVYDCTYNKLEDDKIKENLGTIERAMLSQRLEMIKSLIEKFEML